MKKPNKISIKDISKELGISITTISFIINKKAKNRISASVIKKVEDYIEKVGYKPNSSAQSLRTGKSKTIVFMAENISDPFFSAIAKEMEEVAYNNGYKIIYCSTENNKKRAIELISLFQDRQIDAFIITPPEDFEYEIKELVEQEQQVIMLFDRHYNDIIHNYVVLDNYNGVRVALEPLIEQGFKNILYVGLDSDISPMVERQEAYLETLKDNNLKPRILLTPFKDIKTGRINTTLKDYFKNDTSVDAILFASNGLAICGLRVLKELNIKIPDEIAVVTFDDRDLFELYTPSISVFAQPVSQLANALIEGTLQLLNSKKDKPELFQKILSGNLIIRDSSKKRKALS
ncbi:MAG: LacI family DNA-binding transcriptional regulator [Leeuwenhoekiella sp.]